MEKTVLELCLLCRGGKWMSDPADPRRSIPCPYCDEQGWVRVSPASLGEAAAPKTPETGTGDNPNDGPARKKP